MVITEDQLFDYIYCPAKYHIKHKLGVEVETEGLENKLLKTVANYFFVNLQEGRVPTLNQLKKKWDKICMDNQHIITPDKNIKGWAKIINFAQWCEKEKIIVADVNVPYSIVVDGHMIQGYIDAILVTPEKHIELFEVNFSDKLPDKIDIDMKMKYSLNMEGFKSIYDSYPSVQKIMYPKHNQAFTTTRNQLDFTRIQSTVSNVCKSIQENIYYPRETVMCKSCKCREICRAWHC